MKKAIALIVLAAVMLCICGCGQDTEETAPLIADYQSDSLSVGYAIANITPKESVPMGGYGPSENRLANDVEYPLMATALTFTDSEGETVILIETDLITGGTWLVTARLRISAVTGVPQENIYIGSSHTHASPDMSSSIPSVSTYLVELLDALDRISIEALNDRKPAELYYGSAETENLNFVRNYCNVNEDGTITVFGDNYGQDVTPDSTARHMTDADPTLHIVKITRPEEKDIILANFRAHPHLDNSSSTYALSADYVGAYRETLTAMYDCDFIFMQGAAGNINTYSRLSGEARTDECPQYGLFLSEYTMEALENMTKLETGKVQTQQVMLAGKVNHETDGLVTKAKEISAVWNTSRDVAKTLEMGKPFGIRSPFHANAIGARAALGETSDIELNVFTIGDSLAIATAPLELFDTLSVYMEENSSYDCVLTMGYTGEHIGYMPSSYAFEYTSYETDICRFVAGTGEQVVDTFLSMMKEMKNS